MSSLRRFRWLWSVGACLGAVAACSGNDSKTNAGPGDAGAPSTGGISGTSGAGGSDFGGMGGEDNPGGAGAGGTGTGGAGEGGMTGGSGGAADGGGSVDPVSVVSAVLPDATLNQDYRFVFEANGGSGEGYAFSLEGGSLPPGLALVENGILSGIPLEGGDFELELSVADSDGATARATLGLHVRQSRWLVYWNILSGNETIPRYSAIDLASDDFVRRDLSGTLPTNHNGPDGSPRGFSPDGRFAIYAFFMNGEHVGNELRIVDFDRLANFDWADPMGDEPSLIANRFDDESVKMYGPEWSPDSKRIAVLTLIEDAARDLRSPGRFGWFDIDEVLASPYRSENLRRRLENTGTNFVDWISTDTVVYGSQTIDENENFVSGPLLKATWQGGEPGAPVELHGSMGQTYGESDYLQYVNHSTKTAVIARSGYPHCLPSIELYRFANDEAVNLGETPLLPAPELERFAGVLDTSLKIVDAASQTLADLGPSDCNLVEWSEDGTMLAWVNTTDKRYQVAKVSPNGQAEPLAGGLDNTYETSSDRPQFSSDGRWLAYRADNKLFVARMDEAGIHDRVQISVTLAAPTTDRVGSFQFSPNGRAIVYAAPGQIAGLEDLYLVDLWGEVPGSSRRISPDLSGFPSGDVLVIPPPNSDADEFSERRYPIWDVWTSDSSKVFFIVRDSSSQVGDALYVVDVLATRATPVLVDIGLCDESACGFINGVIPQPLR